MMPMNIAVPPNFPINVHIRAHGRTTATSKTARIWIIRRVRDGLASTPTASTLIDGFFSPSARAAERRPRENGARALRQRVALRLSLKFIVRPAKGDETELALGAGRAISDYAEVSVELVVVLND